MVINGFGAFCSFAVMIVFAVTKFKDGAWFVVLLIPVLVATFFAIHRHYKSLARQLSLDKLLEGPKVRHTKIIMPVSSIHRGTLAALRFARTLSDDITAVHVSIDEKDTAKVREKWDIWGDGYRLVILNSPYRLFLEPLLEYIDEIDSVRKPDEVIAIVVPHFVSQHWWTSFLHTRTAETLRRALLHRENIVITEMPYQVK
jgi:hypothetical protein